jgi:hypothetical protein
MYVLKFLLKVQINFFVEIQATLQIYSMISMAQSIIRDRLPFSVHFKGFTENYPFLFEELQNILKGM